MTKMKMVRDDRGTSFVAERLKVVSDDGWTVDQLHERTYNRSVVVVQNQVMDGSTHRFSMMAEQAVAPLCRNGQRVGSIWLSKSCFLNRQLSIVCTVRLLSR